jgi:hypothetical protein
VVDPVAVDVAWREHPLSEKYVAVSDCGAESNETVTCVPAIIWAPPLSACSIVYDELVPTASFAPDGGGVSESVDAVNDAEPETVVQSRLPFMNHGSVGGDIVLELTAQPVATAYVMSWLVDEPQDPLFRTNASKSPIDAIRLEPLQPLGADPLHVKSVPMFETMNPRLMH